MSRHFETLLIYENTEANSRKGWMATLVEDVTTRKFVVTARWGRIVFGRKLTIHDIASSLSSKQEYIFDNLEKAMAFVDKKVKEKSSKGYLSISQEIEGSRTDYFCEKQPDPNGFIKMESYSGR